MAISSKKRNVSGGMSEGKVRIIRVRVTPSAKKEKVEVAENGSMVIAVRERAADNQANVRVREIVAHHCAVPVHQVRIVAGHRSPTKRLEVTP